MCVRKEERETKESKHFTMEPSILESAIIILSSLEPFPPQAACCNWPLVSGRLPVAPSRCPGRRGCPPADHCLPAHCPARREGEEGRRGEERGGRRGEEGREGEGGEERRRERGRRGTKWRGTKWREAREDREGEEWWERATVQQVKHKRFVCRLLSCYRSADTITYMYLSVSASFSCPPHCWPPSRLVPPSQPHTETPPAVTVAISPGHLIAQHYADINSHGEWKKREGEEEINHSNYQQMFGKVIETESIQTCNHTPPPSPLTSHSHLPPLHPSPPHIPLPHQVLNKYVIVVCGGR